MFTPKWIWLVFVSSACLATDYNVVANAVVMVIDPATNNAGGGVYVANATVITSLHVIGSSKEVIVITRVGRNFKATVMETDPSNDLAKLLVDSPDPHPIAKINFSAVELGQDVFAIAHPNGFGWSLSKGYIMFADERRVRTENDPPTPVLQVDISIYPGTSGGPLFNLSGEVIGIAKGALPGTEIAYFVPTTAFCKKVMKCQKR